MNINDYAVLSRNDACDTNCGVQNCLWSFHSFWMCVPCLYSCFTGVWTDATLDTDSEVAQCRCEEGDLGGKEGYVQIQAAGWEAYVLSNPLPLQKEHRNPPKRDAVCTEWYSHSWWKIS